MAPAAEFRLIAQDEESAEQMEVTTSDEELSGTLAVARGILRLSDMQTRLKPKMTMGGVLGALGAAAVLALGAIAFWRKDGAVQSNLKQSVILKQEGSRFVLFDGAYCFGDHGSKGLDVLQNTSKEECEEHCSKTQHCVGYTIPSRMGAPAPCWTYSWTNFTECDRDTEFSTFLMTCSTFTCPDGFRKLGAEKMRKSNYEQLQGNRPGICCEEALCTCSQQGGSRFSCNQEVQDRDCGQDRECTLSGTWRYFTDRFDACKRRERLGPSNAPVHTFYAYRTAQYGEDFYDGMNVANAVGVIGRLAAEVIKDDLWNRNYIDHIRRLKVTIRPTTLLQKYNMSFGHYYNYDSGKCGGAYYPFYALGYNETVDHCGAGAQKYGPVIGCTTGAYGDYWGDALDDELIWYGIPAPCSQRMWFERDNHCIANYPGGMCNATCIPTGAEDCTFSIEPAGEILIGELCGLPDYDAYVAFYNAGGDEYNSTIDGGVNCSFWNNLFDPNATRRRAASMVQLFKDKFGAEDLEDAFCDYRYDRQDTCAEAILLDTAQGDIQESLADYAQC